jgi:hypothetical protein
VISSIAELFRRLATLELSKDEIIVAGSAPMLLRHLRPCTRDIDVVVHPDSWPLVEKLGPTTIADYASARMVYLDDRQIQLLDGWFYPKLWNNFNDLFTSSRPVRGYHFLTLESTLAWKEYLKRDKDLKDIELIEQYLAAEHESRVAVPIRRVRR